MKQFNFNVVKIKDPDTGQYAGLPAIAGESAYELAVRLGTFSGTEEEYNNFTNEQRDAAIAEIESKRSESVTSIQNTAKIYGDQIVQKGEATLATIPEDYTELSEFVNELDRTRAPGIVCTTTGEQISIDNASDLKFRGLKVYGKGEQIKTNGYQLFDASKLHTASAGGATVTNNGDGSFTVSGTGDTTSPFNLEYTMDDISFLKLGILELSGASEKIAPVFQIIGYNTDKYSDRTFILANNSPSVNITEDILNKTKHIYCVFYLNTNNKIQPGTVKPMLHQDGDGTWEPYTGLQPAPSPEYPQAIHMPGESGSMNVNVTGNQLFDASKIQTKTQGGATVTNNDDGSFTVSGTGITSEVFANIYTYSKEYAPNLKPGTIYAHVGEKTVPAFAFQAYDENEKLVFDLYLDDKTDSSTELTAEMIDRIKTVKILFYTTKGRTIVNGTVKPIVYQSGDGTWEPYTLQTLPITTPNGLPGIPVTSGGNYTDQNGQQWISDVKDYETGKYTQMVQKAVFDGSADEDWIYYGGSGGNPIGLFGINVLSIGFRNQFSLLCNYFMQSENPNIYQNNYCGIDRYNNFWVVIGSIDNLNDFKTWLSDHNLIVLSALSTPIVTDISAEEMAAYNAMHSNYPNTNVFSDQDVEPGMEAKYTADTKMYVDGKFQDLQDSITTMIADAQSQFVTNANMASISQLGTTDKTLVGAINELNSK